MNYRHIAIAAAALSARRYPGPRRRAARGHRAVHQPRLFVLSAGRQIARRTGARSVAADDEPAGRLLGLSRLEGHAGAARPFQPRSAPTPRRAATAKSIRRRWWSTASCTRSAATRRRSSAPSRKAAQSGEPLALPVTLTVDNGTVTVTVPAARGRASAARSGSARSPAKCRSKFAAARTAATP